jgi:glycosyltransferase involved in cell wall biosynthesis
MIQTPLVIITPVYEDTESFYQLAQKIENIYQDQATLVAVEDGSLHHIIDVRHCPTVISIHVLRLKRNVGHQKAISIGLSYLDHKLLDTTKVVVMDSDGEDRPETINELTKSLEQEKVDIAVSVRKSRVESLKFKLFYQVYRLFFTLLTGHNIHFGNFMALKLSAMRRLLSYTELPTHLAGTVILSKCRLQSFPLDRGRRNAGHSKMNFAGLVLHGLRALMIFADFVLVRLGLASLFFIGVIAAVIIAIIFLKSIGMATPGWFSIALGMLTLLLIQIAAFVLMFLMISRNKDDHISQQNILLDLISASETNH